MANSFALLLANSKAGPSSPLRLQRAAHLRIESEREDVIDGLYEGAWYRSKQRSFIIMFGRSSRLCVESTHHLESVWGWFQWLEDSGGWSSGGSGGLDGCAAKEGAWTREEIRPGAWTWAELWRRKGKALNKNGEFYIQGPQNNIRNYSAMETDVERGRKFSSGYKLAAKALTREWTVLGEMEKVSRDYEPVIESYHKVLTKHRNLDVLKRLK